MEIILIIIALAIYFIPSVMAYGKNNFLSILMLNLFLGWTLVGWVIALIWSLSKDAPVQNLQIESRADKLLKLKFLFDAGTISKEDFESQKRKILDE